MLLNRRGFFGTLAAAAAGLALDPERLLWVPGQKAVFLPPLKPLITSPVALSVGDIFTISGIYARNPKTYALTDRLQDFIATANVSSGPISERVICPAMVFDGAYQNVGGVLTPNAVVRPVMWGNA